MQFASTENCLNFPNVFGFTGHLHSYQEDEQSCNKCGDKDEIYSPASDYFPMVNFLVLLKQVWRIQVSFLSLVSLKRKSQTILLRCGARLSWAVDHRWYVWIHIQTTIIVWSFFKLKAPAKKINFLSCRIDFRRPVLCGAVAEVTRTKWGKWTMKQTWTGVVT